MFEEKIFGDLKIQYLVTLKKKDKHIFLKLIKCICSISQLSYPLPDSAQISWL